VDGDVTKL